MKKERKPNQFIHKPIFEGGPQALKEFIKNNLTYPKQALQEKIEGTVHIRYSINYKGEVISSRIISGIGYGCDEEAARLVSMLTFRVPKNRNLRVVFHKTLHVHFRLPTAGQAGKEGSKAATFAYQYTPKTTEPGKEAAEGNQSFFYTIDY